MTNVNILDALHAYFDQGGDPDSLRDMVEMVIRERSDDD